MVTLNEIAERLANRFDLRKQDIVDEIMESQVDTRSSASASNPGLKKQRSLCLTEVKPLHDFVDGQKLENLNVAQLREALSHVPEEDCAVPFLLRFVLGEFHYGQRVTKLKPGQKKLKVAEEKAATTHQSKVSDAFDVLARESSYNHLHQMAGWIDIDSENVWHAYVSDVMGGKLRDGDRLFEAGCGVLAFLRSAEQLAKNVTIGGLDGAPKTIQLIKEQFVFGSVADNFSVGFLPDAMSRVEDNSWDIVVCNSVFQYFADIDQAKKAVEEMIRAAKRWVIIADVIDEKYAVETQRYKEKIAGASSSLPDYLTYARSWWEQFDSTKNLVSIKKVESQTYVRRLERYTVYIEKNAPIVNLINEEKDSNKV